MKKYLSFLIILLLSFCVSVHAEDSSLKIKSITIDSKSDDVEEIEKPTYEGLDVNLSVRVFEENDYIKYKIEIENTSSSEVTLDMSDLGITRTEEQSKWCWEYPSAPLEELSPLASSKLAASSNGALINYTNSCDVPEEEKEYYPSDIKFEFDSEDACNSFLDEQDAPSYVTCVKRVITEGDHMTYEVTGETTIKGNGTGIIYVTITYDDAKDNTDGCNVSTENEDLNVSYLLNLSNNEENPNTKTGISIIISILIITIISIILLNKNKSIQKYTAVIVLALGLTGLITIYSVNAVSDNKININANVEIGCKGYHVYLTASISKDIPLSDDDFNQFDSYMLHPFYDNDYVVVIDYGIYEPGKEVTIDDVKCYSSLLDHYWYFPIITENECDERAMNCVNEIGWTETPLTIIMPEHDAVYAIDMKK